MQADEIGQLLTAAAEVPQQFVVRCLEVAGEHGASLVICKRGRSFIETGVSSVLIKSADDREPDIAALEALQRRPDVDADTRKRIDLEIKRIRAGVAGERDATNEIEFVLGPSGTG